jgi:hypothetical protein
MIPTLVNDGAPTARRWRMGSVSSQGPSKQSWEYIYHIPDASRRRSVQADRGAQTQTPRPAPTGMTQMARRRQAFLRRPSMAVSAPTTPTNLGGDRKRATYELWGKAREAASLSPPLDLPPPTTTKGDDECDTPREGSPQPQLPQSPPASALPLTPMMVPTCPFAAASTSPPLQAPPRTLSRGGDGTHPPPRTASRAGDSVQPPPRTASRAGDSTQLLPRTLVGSPKMHTCALESPPLAGASSTSPHQRRLRPTLSQRLILDFIQKPATCPLPSTPPTPVRHARQLPSGASTSFIDSKVVPEHQLAPAGDSFASVMPGAVPETSS